MFVRVRLHFVSFFEYWLYWTREIYTYMYIYMCVHTHICIYHIYRVVRGTGAGKWVRGRARGGWHVEKFSFLANSVYIMLPIVLSACGNLSICILRKRRQASLCRRGFQFFFIRAQSRVRVCEATENGRGVLVNLYIVCIFVYRMCTCGPKNIAGSSVYVDIRYKYQCNGAVPHKTKKDVHAHKALEEHASKPMYACTRTQSSVCIYCIYIYTYMYHIYMYVFFFLDIDRASFTIVYIRVYM